MDSKMTGKERLKEKLRITCIERKYRVIGSKLSYIIAAKKELNENITERLLHEDMELKTFLSDYEIVNISGTVSGGTVSGGAVSGGAVSGVKKEDINIDVVKIKQKPPRKTVAMERRELFNLLDLPEEFTTADYNDAIIKKEMEVTYSTMANEDFAYLVKNKIIERTGNKKKAGDGKHWFYTYRRIIESESKDTKEDKNKEERTLVA